MEEIEYTYDKYADDVLNGSIPACEAIYLACKRYKAFRARSDMYFDEEDVHRKIRVVSRLKHSQGEYSRKPFILLPWEQWIFANIFGFKWKDTGYRVTKNAFIMISRKNGKSALASSMGIICAVADNEDGAEVDIVANSRQQAKITFKYTSYFCESADKKKKIFLRYRDSIMIPKTKSIIQVLSSDSMGNDGYNSSCYILDEFHAAKNWDLYNVLKSSQGMRSQPLSIIITTAGFLLNGYPCYEHRIVCKDILKGLKKDDSQFSAIYELDEGDDWLDEKNWLKCNPSLGQTVKIDYMREQVQAVHNNPSLETGVKTKNFNVFCQSKTIWLADKYLEGAWKDVGVDDFRDEDCYMGVDLSSVSDLTATAVMFPPNPDRKLYPDKFVFVNRLYIPDDNIDDSVNAELYKLWKRQGYLLTTSGNVVDYDEILRDQIDIYNKTYIRGVMYDEWNASAWASDAYAEGLPLKGYSQTVGNFNKPTKMFEMLLRQDKIVIQYNPLVRWCFSNVELKHDQNDNCLALDTVVPTPNGYTTIDKLQVGDYVFDEKGKPTKVIGITDTHYNRDCYKIKFYNGAEVVCDYTHNWYVNYVTTDKNRHTHKTYGYKDTEWVYNHYKNNKGLCKRHTIMNQPVEYTEKTFTLDPYTLGQWLGDGSSWGSTFTCEEKDLSMYSYLEDKYTVTYTYDEGKTYNIYVAGGLRTTLKEMGLLRNKHIPTEYKFGSIEQRLELIRGLMDTDGTCNKSTGQCCFLQANNHYDIIVDMSEILSSLGIKHTINRKDNYTIIQFYTNIRVFNLERKYKNQDKYKPVYDWHNPILNVEKVESVPTRCITVENDSHLFLITDKYLVTSNCKPIKAGNDLSKKIDPVIAMIQALGGWINDNMRGVSDGEVVSV